MKSKDEKKNLKIQLVPLNTAKMTQKDESGQVVKKRTSPAMVCGPRQDL